MPYNLTPRESVTDVAKILMEDGQENNPEAYCHVTYYKNRMTGEIERMFKTKLEDDDWQSGHYIKTVMPLIKSWDLVRAVEAHDAEGNPILDKNGNVVIEFVPVPATVEGAATLDVEVMGRLLAGVIDHATPGEAKGSNSNVTSLPVRA